MFSKLKNTYFYYDITQYENILDDPNNTFGRRVNFFITFLVLLFIFSFIIESVENIGTTYAFQFFLFDAFISIVFALEYIYRFIKAVRKFDFIINFQRIIDLLSFLPFFL